jgi:hypothetical protein
LVVGKSKKEKEKERKKKGSTPQFSYFNCHLKKYKNNIKYKIIFFG